MCLGNHTPWSGYYTIDFEQEISYYILDVKVSTLDEKLGE